MTGSVLRTLLLAAALVVACAPADEPAPPSPAPATDIVQARPPGQAGQGIAKVNLLHVTHATADEPVGCDGCHPEGEAPAAAEHRCLGCHEGRDASIHTAQKDAEARECLACHDFLHGPGGMTLPWGCQGCHAAPDKKGPTRHDDPPAISAHREVNCDQCHTPHLGDKVATASCSVTCHQDQITTHDERATDEASRCIACHTPHHPASAAAGKCASCHEKEAAGETLRQGHQSCDSCHAPHEAPDELVKPCASCHEDVRDDLSDLKDHKDCASCHTAHDLGRPMNLACATCHERHRTYHPAAEGKDTCNTCHQAHEPGATALISTASCKSCHERPGGVSAPHGGASCATCHTPHSRQKVTPIAGRCASCHDGGGPGPRVATLPRGHQDCSGCHTGPAHAPRQNVASCESCHDDVAARHTGVVDGHKACTSCHTPHAPGRAANISCTTCHDDVPSDVASGGPHTACASCHPSHPVSGGTAPLSCRSCHDGHTTGHAKGSDKAGCEACHTVHDKKRARVVSDVGCTQCHWENGQAASWHGGARCTGCHAPHADPIDLMPDSACSACHSGAPGQGAKIAPDEGHLSCSECHEGHAHGLEPTDGRCASCHELPGATFPEGHQRCADCHEPHTGHTADVGGCVACHDLSRKAGVEALAHDAGDCARCHEPHGPRPPAFTDVDCKSCHTSGKVADDPRVRPAKGHDRCSDCHTGGGHERPTQIVSCRTCHEEQHAFAPEGHRACADCHDSHTTRVPKTRDCASCHEKQSKDAHRAVREGCDRCHGGAHVEFEPPSCRLCHGVIVEDDPKHAAAPDRDCRDCHNAHDTALPRWPDER